MSGVDLSLTLKLRDLLTTYGTLRHASPGGAQRRGQQFNNLLAELMRAWGVDARESVKGIRGRDEIDVFFTVAGINYILEAKWEAKATDINPVAKAKERLETRPPGTRAVLVSMSGYTAPVHDRAAHNPAVLLLDRTHIEAMLCGLIGPEELLGRLYAYTAAHGGAYATLADLLIRNDPVPEALIPAVAQQPWPVIGELRQGVTATPRLIGSWQAEQYPQGMTYVQGNRLLVTTSAGVVEIQRSTGVTKWALNLPRCGGRAIRRDDAALAVWCNGAAVRWHKKTGNLALIGGALGDFGALLQGPDDELWAFSQVGPSQSNEGSPVLTRFGQGPGDETRYEIDFPADIQGVAWLGDNRFFLSANGYSAVIDLDRSVRVEQSGWIPSALPDPGAVVVVGAHEVLVASVRQTLDGFVYTTNPVTGVHTRQLQLTVNRIYDVAVVPSSSAKKKAFVLAEVGGNDPLPHPILIEVDLPL